MRLTFIFILFTYLTSGQEKPMIFYNESGEKISKENFIKTKDYSKNLDLYFENDTTQIGLLVTRQKFGQLDKNTFENLKSYLTELTEKKIDSTHNIVINYLTCKLPLIRTVHFSKTSIKLLFFILLGLAPEEYFFAYATGDIFPSAS